MNIVGGYIKIYATSEKFTNTQLISIGAQAKGEVEGGEIPHKKTPLFRKTSLWIRLKNKKEVKTKSFSIYTLSDLGDLSNLISSLSRTIQQYSPPCEWIMYELGFVLNF